MLWLAVVSAAKTSWTSEELARRDQLAELYQQEAVSLVRLARLFTDDRTGAEDIVQEAFIRFFHKADRIEDVTKSAAYLRSIVLNLVRDYNRRGMMSLRHQDAMVDDRTPEQPEQEVVRNESQIEVLDALASLPPRQRECLVLRFYAEMTETEIASTLSISPNSVKTHCRRGMEALSGKLERAS